MGEVQDMGHTRCKLYCLVDDRMGLIYSDFDLDEEIVCRGCFVGACFL